MLATMISCLQRHMEHHDAYDMVEHLKEMFGRQAMTERFETIRYLHGCKMEETSNVSTHVLKMKSYMNNLKRLGSPHLQDLATDLILNLLPKSYDTFIMNYNMNCWDKVSQTQ